MLLIFVVVVVVVDMFTLHFQGECMQLFGKEDRALQRSSFVHQLCKLFNLLLSFYVVLGHMLQVQVRTPFDFPTLFL